jgi:glycosyltransferase involved in cell wall biosynthesis
VIDDLAPMPDRDAGSNAILSHMRALQRLGFEVSFVAADELWSKQDARAVLEALDIECCRAPFYASVEEVLRRQTDCFELIYLHRASNAAKYLALARHFCPRARILYSVADLHHVRLARQAKIEQRPELLARSQRLRLTEFTAASLANAVITHSIAEAQSLRSAVTGCNVHVVPWAVPARPTSVAWSERRGIAFIGSFSHAPNLDAARYLIEQIMPRVWQQDASMQCLLVGSHMPESIKHLSSDQVVVLGQVPDLSTVYGRVRMTVAPLRFGAGVKGKVLDSLAAGLPCVMSPIAAEGIVLPSTLADLVCADIEAFATRILQQHSAEAQADASSAAGVRFITQCYAESMVVDALKAAVEGRRAPPAPPALAAIEAQR